jgi:hypothetical protein
MARFTRTWRISRLWIAIVATVSLPVPSSAVAATVDDLYSVRVSRSLSSGPGQLVRTQQEEIRFALIQVLTRVTGRVDIALEPAMADMLAGAEQFVVQSGTIDRETFFVTFDAPAIETALIAREQPIWGPERPLTVLWLAIDDGQGGRDILAAADSIGDQSPEFQTLKAAFREEIFSIGEERGLPLALPLMDLEDMSTIGFVDIWGGFGTQLEQASTRYGADSVVSGRARVSSFGVDVEWTLIRGGQRISLGGGSLRNGLDRLADYYVAEFSTFGGTRSTTISVLGVATLEDYGRVMRYLESLSILDSVGTEIDFEGDTLSVRVDARGSSAVVERVLGLNPMLTPSADVALMPTESRVTFRFVR